MKKLPVYLSALLCISQSFGQNKLPVYKNSKAPIESRVQDLVSRMTLKEKVLQLSQGTAGGNDNVNNVEAKLKAIPDGIGSLIYFSEDPIYRNQIQKRAVEHSRLGIPIIFGYDVIHGFRTVYATSIAQACSFNTSLSAKASAVAAKEAKLSGIDWTFSPMIDVARDPRWGRIVEGYGEDVYTNARFAVAAVKGYQGSKLTDPYSIAACLKHYIGYGLSEGGRDYHYADVSAQSLWETYMPPYEAGVKAGAVTLMSGFNDISGTPASANYYTLTAVLKNRWKHDGFVISDWGSVEQLIDQGVAATRAEAGRKAINAGVDMDMTDHVWEENLEKLVTEKKVPLARVNDAVKRVLRVKFKLGLFDHPYTDVVDENKRYLQPESWDVIEKLAEESMVLLKNQDAILPLKRTFKKIALIGPIANNQEDLVGSWAAHGRPSDTKTILSALKDQLGNGADIKYALGCNFDGNDTTGFADAANTASKADAIVLCLGEKRAWSGENTSRSTIALPAIQQQLIQRLKAAGKPIVLVLASGRPLAIAAEEPLADAIVAMWQTGIAGGTPLAKVLTGEVNPSGKLSVTFPRSTGQIPVYYSMRQSARPTSGKYQDIATDPLYWFGYGLSYTKFKYGDLQLTANSIKKTQKLIAKIVVTNTGAVAGKETMLWYIAQPAASISRPMKELKFFEKKEIAAGAQTVYQFEIDPMRDLSFPDADGKRHLEAGDFYLMAGEQKVKFRLVD